MAEFSVVSEGMVDDVLGTELIEDDEVEDANVEKVLLEEVPELVEIVCESEEAAPIHP